tara:strand:+ start:22287 stop:22601 length:315 start_codon:yes stop_codon:yes gene_type:complete
MKKLLACVAILGMNAVSLGFAAHFAVNSELNAADELVPLADRRPAELTWEHVESEDGGVLAWIETDEDGERHQYETRIPASDPEADENINEWDKQNAEDWKPGE